jgi:hypothetical protein
MNDKEQFEKNKNLFETFFICLICACCLVLILPFATSSPKYVLSSFFFISVSVVGLFLTWIYLLVQQNGCYHQGLSNSNDNFSAVKNARPTRRMHFLAKSTKNKLMRYTKA